MEILLFFLAILPGLGICFYIFKTDKYEQEAWWALLICFLLGVVCTYPAIELEQSVIDRGYDITSNLLEVFLYALFGVAVIEEVAKTLCLFIFPYFTKNFNEPMDGIVYAVMIGMGFATLENVIYANNFGLETVLVRAFTAIPAHAIFAVITGYYVGLSKFDKDKRILNVLKGLGWAILIHAIYDFFLLQEMYDWLSAFAIVTLLVSYQFAKKMIHRHQVNSPFFTPANAPQEDTVAANAPPTGTWDEELDDLMNTQNEE